LITKGSGYFVDLWQRKWLGTGKSSWFQWTLQWFFKFHNRHRFSDADE
jgi:hypothetical protein